LWFVIITFATAVSLIVLRLTLPRIFQRDATMELRQMPFGSKKISATFSVCQSLEDYQEPVSDINFISRKSIKKGNRGKSKELLYEFPITTNDSMVSINFLDEERETVQYTRRIYFASPSSCVAFTVEALSRKMLLLESMKRWTRSADRGLYLFITRAELDPYVVKGSHVPNAHHVALVKKPVIIKSDSQFINLASSYDQMHSFGDAFADRIKLADDDVIDGLMLEFEEKIFYSTQVDLFKTDFLYAIGCVISFLLLFISIGKLIDSAMYRKYIVRPATTTIYNSRPRTNLDDNGEELSYFNNDIESMMSSKPASMFAEPSQYDSQKLKTMKVDESNVANVLRSHSEFLELP